LTFLAALRATGSPRPASSTGRSTAPAFARKPAPAKAGVEQFLVPTLNAGDIVIIDNLGSHKAAPVVS
jgi:hypothetical protein